MSAAGEPVDLALLQWRNRLAAASRNVSELSELPEYAAAREAARGTGALAEEARKLVATMNELWQGVLLIGATLDRAEAARKGGSRLWRSDAAAAEALEILTGPSISVDLAETPVLHRRLLAGPRATATVSPETLLQTMDAAFDRARERLTRITQANARVLTLRRRVAAAIAALPGAEALAAELAAAELPDTLDRLAALEALSAKVEGVERAAAGIAAARSALVALQSARDAARSAAEAATARLAVSLPSVDGAGLTELAAWLEQIAATLAAGRAPAALLGLGNWHSLHDRLGDEIAALHKAASDAAARADDLAARYGALRAKHKARPTTPELDALAASAKSALAKTPMQLATVSRAIEIYEAALSKKV
jgi:hypothetical protein